MTRDTGPSSATRIWRILVSGVLLCLLLIGCRAAIVKPSLHSGDVLNAARMLLSASSGDLALGGLFTAVFIGLAAIAGLRPWAGRIVQVLFYLGTTVIAVTGVINVKIVELLGEPFSLPWLYYSDFLSTGDSLSGMADAASPTAMGLLAAAVLGLLAGGWLIGALFDRLGARWPAAGIAAGVLLMAGLLLGNSVETGLPPGKTANPILAFVDSTLINSVPQIFTQKTSATPDDVLTVAERAPDQLPPRAATGIRNVIIASIEDMDPNYIQTYGGRFPVTPNLLAYRGSSLQFEDVYAHVPATNYSTVALIASIYPNISWKSMTSEYSAIPLTTIAGQLHDRGLATAFFNSGDLRFQSLNRFLKNRGFDRVSDFHGVPCDVPVFNESTEQWKYLDAISDICMGDEMIRWLKQVPDDKPFFGMLMMNQSHYPYMTTGSPVRYQSDDTLNRYLGALGAQDQAIGNVLAYLKKSGKLDSTLVVIVSDNGEAFGQHGNFLHASGIYEENLRIPMILINGRLFHGETSHVVGGIIDIAPTIFDLMGLPLPKTWQGRSLFASGRPGRTYFFCPWNGFLFGYRENQVKVIFNARTGEFSAFDLSRDRAEKINIANQMPSLRAAAIDHIAAWVQYQSRMMAKLVAEIPAGERSPDESTEPGSDDLVETDPSAAEDNAAPFTVPFSIHDGLQVAAYADPTRNFEIGFDPAAKAAVVLRQRTNDENDGMAAGRPFLLDVNLVDTGGSQWITADRILGRVNASEQYRVTVVLVARLLQPGSGASSNVQFEFSIPQNSGQDFRVKLGTAALSDSFQSFTFRTVISPEQLVDIKKDGMARVMAFLPLQNGLSVQLARYDVQFVKN